MMSPAPSSLAAIRWIALAIGVVLFLLTIYVVDIGEAARSVRQLGMALPIALAVSGVAQLARTWSWAWCFPGPRTVSFWRLARVRLAAEAFSYLTLRGIAGEPLKVLLLAGAVDTRQATAAVALERLAFTVGTLFIVGGASLYALAALPLTNGWFRVFRAFAIAAGVAAVLTGAAVTGRGTYLRSLMQRLDRRAGWHLSESAFGRFVSTVERLMLELVREHPRRLMVLFAATSASFLSMVLEAWVILRVVNPEISMGAVFAVETFSRVAAFASAMIPANIGALEASSVAAVMAIGAAGGAALAVERRIRGLLWAGLGLLVYPRQRLAPPQSKRSGGGGRDTRANALLYLPCAADVEVQPWIRIAGLPIAERVIRSAWRAGYTRVIVLSPDAARDSDAAGHESSRARRAAARRLSAVLRGVPGEISVVRTEREWRHAVGVLPPGESLTIVGPGTVPSPALLETALMLSPFWSEVCDVPAGPEWRESGVLRVGRHAAVDLATLDVELARRRRNPTPLPDGEAVSQGRARLALRVLSREDLPDAERTIRRASYKDTDGVVARFNRRVSMPISIALIRTPLTANQLSLLLVAIGFYAAWLFSIGHYWSGVLGASLSLAASVLDGCDGEIARLKYQESSLGCWIETLGDYSYYLAIFVGLTIGAARQTGLDVFYAAGGAALCGTLVSFALLIYLRGRITQGRPERLNAIARDRFESEGSRFLRALWKVSFVATRAAMPYGILALALVSALPAMIVLAAIGANVYWVALAVKMRNLLAGSSTEGSATT